MLAVAEIARVGVLDDELDQRLAAELLGHRPGLGLVEPHQRRVDHHGGVHAEAERDLERLERVVAAVGIGREVGLAHAADEHRQAAPVGDGRGEGEEEEVAAGDEAVGEAAGAHLVLARGGRRRAADLVEQREVEDVVLAEARRPAREVPAQLRAHLEPAFALGRPALAVDEADRLDVVVALERVGEADGRVLAAREEDEGVARVASHAAPPGRGRST